MPKGPARPWKKLQAPVLDGHIAASVLAGKDAAHPPGEHGGDGARYGEMTIDCASPDEAAITRRALFRAAQRLGYSLHCPPARKHRSGGWRLVFAACCKQCARIHVIATYGPDREAWPYNPRRKNRKQGE